MAVVQATVPATADGRGRLVRWPANGAIAADAAIGVISAAAAASWAGPLQGQACAGTTPIRAASGASGTPASRCPPSWPFMTSPDGNERLVQRAESGRSRSLVADDRTAGR